MTDSHTRWIGSGVRSLGLGAEPSRCSGEAPGPGWYGVTRWKRRHNAVASPMAMSLADVPSLSVPIPINRTRGERHDRYLHLRRLLQPRRLRRRQRQLDRLLG